MDFVSHGPLKVSGLVWLSHAGTHVLTVVAKASFILDPGTSHLSPRQEELNERDLFWNGDARCSLYAPSDLVPFKERADVFLVGHAYSPDRRPVRSLMTNLRISSIEKSIEIFCDRRLRMHDGRYFEAHPFVAMPLCWERAAGGPGTTNPVGMSIHAAPDMYGTVPIPNLQPPGSPVAAPASLFTPIGFGPVSPGWTAAPSRRARLPVGRSLSGLDEAPLSQMRDNACFNFAPRDQQVNALRADEVLFLENLHPRHARLLTRLPGVRPRAFAERESGAREEVALRPDTLWIDTDRGLCTLTWRGCVALRHASERGRIDVVVDGACVSSWAMPHARDVDESSETGTLSAPLMGPAPKVLPFGPAASSVTLSEVVVPTERAPRAPHSEGTETVLAPMDAGFMDPLPFRRIRGGAANEAAVGEAQGVFAVPSVATNPEILTVSPQGNDDSEALPWEGMHQGAVSSSAAPVAIGRSQDGVLKQPLPPPPPMLGPLGMPVSDVRNEVRTAKEDKAEREEHETEPPPRAPDNVNARLDGLGASLEDYPLERCAAIAASVARRPANAPDLIAQHGLDEAAWRTLDGHYGTQIRREVEQGRSGMLRRYDAAYVAQLERERGPIRPEEYAHLVTAAQYGGVGEVLRKIELPSGSWIKIQRIWVTRLAEEPELARKVREVLARLGDQS